MADLNESALVALDPLTQAIAETDSIPDLKTIRDLAEAMKAGMKSRQAGIGNENKAAALVLRAERRIGRRLVEMADTGERNTGGGGPRTPGLQPNQYGASPRVPSQRAQLPTLADFGLTRKQAWLWQRLAQEMDDEEFEEALADLLEDERMRLSKVNFWTKVRGADPKPEAPKKEPLVPTGPTFTEAMPTEEPVTYTDEWSGPWARMQAASAELLILKQRGLPIKRDRTVEGWALELARVNDMIEALLNLQSRMEYYAAGGD